MSIRPETIAQNPPDRTAPAAERSHVGGSAQSLTSGKIFRGPEKRETKAGKVFAVATLRAGDGPHSDFWRVVAFEPASLDLLACAEGDSISVKGRLQVRQYDKAGEQRIALQITADQVMKLARAAKGRAGR